MSNTVKIEFTFDEIKDVLMNLDQCLSEGYIHVGDPSNTAITKLERALNEK